jgi:TonB family protein
MTACRGPAVILSALIVLCFCLVGQSGRAFAQVPSSTDMDYGKVGVELYRKGDFKEATRFLRSAVKKKEHQNRPETWYYLGLAFFRLNELKDSRKAFEKTIKLNPNFEQAHVSLAYLWLQNYEGKKAVREAEQGLRLNAANTDAHYIIGLVRLREQNLKAALEKADTVLKLNRNYAPAWLLKGQALLATWAEVRKTSANKAADSTAFEAEKTDAARWERLAIIREAITSLEEYLKLVPDKATTVLWRDTVEGLRSYLEIYDKPESQRNVFGISETGITKPIIAYREKASYTEEARQNKEQGTVALLVLVNKDGTVRPLFVIAGLRYGLTESALAAARKMRFQPATKDGKPVAVTMMIEFTFNIY